MTTTKSQQPQQTLLEQAGFGISEELLPFIKKGGKNVNAETLRKGNLAIIVIDLSSVQKTDVSKGGKSYLWGVYTPLLDFGSTDGHPKNAGTLNGYSTSVELKSELKE